MAFEILTDATKLVRHSAKLPQNEVPRVAGGTTNNSFNYGDPIEQGEWVDLAQGNTIARITGVSNSHNTFPVWTNTGRIDVHFSNTVTLPLGSNYIFKTDQHDGDPDIGDLLGVTGGKLVTATTSHAIRAICMDKDMDGTITCRMLEAGNVTA